MAPTASLKCCCEPPSPGASAKLILSEDFEGEKLNSPDLTYYTSTPRAYTGLVKPYTTHEGLTCGYYYAQRGTNEQTPWMVSCETDDAERLINAQSFSEFCFEWKEFFASGYPWPHGQKMCRFGYENGAEPSSKKSFELACLDENGNLQAALYHGLWGSDDYGSREWFENTGKSHPEDRWVTWRCWVKLNDARQANGFVKLTLDGAPFITAENLNLRGDDPYGFNWFWTGGNYSMEGGVGGLERDGDRYVTGLRWWNTSPA